MTNKKAKKPDIPFLRNGRLQSAARILSESSVAWACRREQTCPCGSHTAWQGRSCRRPWGTCTPPPEWTGYPWAAKHIEYVAMMTFYYEAKVCELVQ